MCSQRLGFHSPVWHTPLVCGPGSVGAKSLRNTAASFPAQKSHSESDEVSVEVAGPGQVGVARGLPVTGAAEPRGEKKRREVGGRGQEG